MTLQPRLNKCEISAVEAAGSCRVTQVKNREYLQPNSTVGEHESGKGKGHPIRGHEGPKGEQMYSSTLPSTSTLDGGGWSTPRPGRFTPRKETRYPLNKRLGGPQGLSGRVREISPPPHRDSIPGPSSPLRVAIPTELFRLK